MSIASPKLSPKRWERAILDEERAFNRALPALISKYDGRYVAFYQGRVMAANTDEEILASEMKRILGDVPWIIEKVTRRPEKLTFESPEAS
jgi:hypothetical protein